jgi:hypothetical protein
MYFQNIEIPESPWGIFEKYTSTINSWFSHEVIAAMLVSHEQKISH